MDFMAERYRGLDQLTAMSHMNCYMVMNEFFRVNTERLIADKMIKPADPEYRDGSLAYLWPWSKCLLSEIRGNKN